MSDPVAEARAALHHSRWPATLLGVFSAAAAFFGLLMAALWFLRIDLPAWPLAAGCVALFAALEVPVRRHGQAQRAPGLKLLDALLPEMRADEPEAGWYAGLPYLRGKRGERHYAVHLEAAEQGLRVGVSLSAPHSPPVWLCNAESKARVAGWMARLEAEQRHQPVPSPQALQVLSPEPQLGEPWAERHAEALRGVLCANAPAAGTLEILGGDARFETTLTERVDAPLILNVITTLDAVLAEDEADDQPL